MKDTLDKIREDVLRQVREAVSLDSLEEIRVRALGRKGALTDILRGLSQASEDERPMLGKLANEVKKALSDALDAARESLENSSASKGGPAVDLSLPGRRPPRGHTHPITQTIDEIVEIFREMGFQVATGPDIETEYYNFDSLNTPGDHPARDLHDTFFVKPGVVLRTQTSPVQMRVMESTPPPVAVIVPGRVFRVDADATHSPMFHQIEGLLVDEDITFADLKGTLERFVHRFFGPDVRMRFRPHFFPFTEPSAEMDIYWSAGNRSGWMEVLGCGMVHPKVFGHAGYDPEKYTGYAFGMGVDRIAMVRYAIDSIGHLYENDLRFLEQF
jgi:phenylalanyl-tRNA synthetase alpha chain